MLPMLEAAKVPAPVAEILKVLVRHAPTYAVTVRHEGEWAALFGPYLEVLDAFSLDNIEDAFRRWNRGEDMKDPSMGQFYPKPSQLVALANKSKLEVWTAAYRCRKALEWREAQAPREVPEHERQAVAAGLRDLAAQFSMKAIPETMRPRMTPQEVAARIRAQADDVGIVI